MSELPKLKKPSWADRLSKLGAIELFEKYRRRSVHDETELPFEPGENERKFTFEALAFATAWGMRLALTVFMPLCATTFALSFLWDWHGLIRSCSVAGMIGFATNWVAIKMLFWPRESRPIFGQGLIPSQRDQLIEKDAFRVVLGRAVQFGNQIRTGPINVHPSCVSAELRAEDCDTELEGFEDVLKANSRDLQAAEVGAVEGEEQDGRK